MIKNKLILVGCPLSPNYQADTRTICAIEEWRSNGNVLTYYPSSGYAELGYDKIVNFANRLTPRPDYILFMDYDVIPRHNTLEKLIAADKDIISGVYPLAQRCEIKWCLSKDEPFSAMEIGDLPDNMFKASTICNGIMLVKTEVFDNLQWPYWRSQFVKGGVSMGHDIYFCKKAREAGYDLWVDPKIKCSHIKSVDLLGIAKSYTANRDKNHCKII